MSHGPDQIAYWLEAAEARVYAELYVAMRGHDMDPQVIADDDSATFWLRGLDFGFFNRSVGLGIGKPATESDIDAAVTAFESAGLTQYAIQLSPLARPASLERSLEARGLTRGRRWAKVWRDTEDPPDERTSLRIERIGRSHEDAWVSVCRAAYEMPATMDRWFSANLDAPGWSHYLAFDAEQAVGAGAMRQLGDVAWFGFGGTLESHRGRGAHSSIFARRIRDAGAAGVRLCISETGEDVPEASNPSYRNMLRSGFRLAYHRQNWIPAQPANG